MLARVKGHFRAFFRLFELKGFFEADELVSSRLQSRTGAQRGSKGGNRSHELGLIALRQIAASEERQLFIPLDNKCWLLLTFQSLLFRGGDRASLCQFRHGEEQNSAGL